MDFVLGSRSPRRAALLREAGYLFEQVDPPYDDPAQPEGDAGEPERVAMELARRKAISLVPRRRMGQVVVTADTLCVGADGRLLGTPESAEEAGAMLRRFVRAEHRVVTGVAVLGDGDEGLFVFADTATVRWGEVSDEALSAYVMSGGWRGKAGGYNLFDRRDAGWPIGVEGDETTVVGLPMGRLRVVLRERGIEAEHV